MVFDDFKVKILNVRVVCRAIDAILWSILNKWLWMSGIFASETYTHTHSRDVLRIVQYFASGITKQSSQLLSGIRNSWKVFCEWTKWSAIKKSGKENGPLTIMMSDMIMMFDTNLCWLFSIWNSLDLFSAYWILVLSSLHQRIYVWLFALCIRSSLCVRHTSL